jgi:hypothetical protein
VTLSTRILHSLLDSPVFIHNSPAPESGLSSLSKTLRGASSGAGPEERRHSSQLLGEKVLLGRNSGFSPEISKYSLIPASAEISGLPGVQKARRFPNSTRTVALHSCTERRVPTIWKNAWPSGAERQSW